MNSQGSSFYLPGKQVEWDDRRRQPNKSHSLKSRRGARAGSWRRSRFHAAQIGNPSPGLCVSRLDVRSYNMQLVDWGGERFSASKYWCLACLTASQGWAVPIMLGRSEYSQDISSGGLTEPTHETSSRDAEYAETDGDIGMGWGQIREDRKIGVRYNTKKDRSRHTPKEKERGLGYGVVVYSGALTSVRFEPCRWMDTRSRQAGVWCG